MTEKKLIKKKARILIIDDSPAILRLTKQVITFKDECEVQFASNGKEALEIIEKEKPFDLILLDIEMPVLDGEKCVEAIKSLPDTVKANVPVIACTGNAKENSPQQFKRMGFADSFVKPIDYPNLIRKINSILENPKK